MKNFNKILVALTMLLVLASFAFGQATTTQTTLSSAVNSTTTIFPLTSVTNVLAPSGPNGTRTILFIDRSAYFVQSISGNNVTVIRGVKGTWGGSAHLTGATVWVGQDNGYTFVGSVAGGAPSYRGACTAANQITLPVIEISSGRALTCAGGRWGVLQAFAIDASNCTFIPTTLTTTNILTQVGASGHMVMQGTSNAAAGTNTLTCNITLPIGAQLIDINTFLGSQTTAPTSFGTATLGSVTYPTANATETASVEVPVTVGGTVTTTTPTALTTVTTAGRFLTVLHTFSTPVRMADLQMLIYQFPILQSAGAAMVLNTPGLLVHYMVSPANSF